MVAVCLAAAKAISLKPMAPLVAAFFVIDARSDCRSSTMLAKRSIANDAMIGRGPCCCNAAITWCGWQATDE
jgi:hypothetical protein